MFKKFGIELLTMCECHQSTKSIQSFLCYFESFHLFHLSLATSLALHNFVYQTLSAIILSSFAVSFPQSWNSHPPPSGRWCWAESLPFSSEQTWLQPTDLPLTNFLASLKTSISLSTSTFQLTIILLIFSSHDPALLLSHTFLIMNPKLLSKDPTHHGFIPKFSKPSGNIVDSSDVGIDRSLHLTAWNSKPNQSSQMIQGSFMQILNFVQSYNWMHLPILASSGKLSTQIFIKIFQTLLEFSPC